MYLGICILSRILKLVSDIKKHRKKKNKMIEESDVSMIWNYRQDIQPNLTSHSDS